jgi:hypothetical protein
MRYGFSIRTGTDVPQLRADGFFVFFIPVNHQGQKLMHEGSKIKVKTLKRVLGDGPFETLVANACVLYEDLKIEAEGMTQEKLPELSQTHDSDYVQRYFFRRTLTTLAEARNLILKLDTEEHFKEVIQPNLHQDGLEGWKEAVEFADSEDYKRVEQVRQQLTDELLGESIQQALKGLKEDTSGVLELVFESGIAADVHCHFVGELTAQAFAAEPSDTPEEKFGELLEILERGHEAFIFAFQVLIGACVVPRFGF